MFILLPTKWWVLALGMNPKGNMSFQASDDNIDSLNILSSLIIQHFQYMCLQVLSQIVFFHREFEHHVVTFYRYFSVLKFKTNKYFGSNKTTSITYNKQF